MINFPILRNDDILQASRFTKDMQRTLKSTGKTLFELFLDADRMFAESGCSCTLAVLSEGVDVYRDWVKHIKDNGNRYKIELHGREHFNHNFMSRERLKKELSEAKKKIEDTFEIKITTWYLPFGRKGENVHGEEVCKELGIIYDKQIGKVDAKFWFKKPEDYPHVNFHFWRRDQVDVVKQIIKLWHLKKDISLGIKAEKI